MKQHTLISTFTPDPPQISSTADSANNSCCFGMVRRLMLEPLEVDKEEVAVKSKWTALNTLNLFVRASCEQDSTFEIRPRHLRGKVPLLLGVSSCMHA